MQLEQISHQVLKLLRILLWIGFGLIILSVLLFALAYGGDASVARRYVLPIVLVIPGLLLATPPGVILLKIWLVKRQINEVRETGEKIVKVAKFADKAANKLLTK